MRTLYIVQQIHWAYSDEWFYEDGERPVRAFASPADAQLYQGERESEARQKIAGNVPEDDYAWWSQNLNATFGGLRNITSLDPGALNAQLDKLGLPRYPSETGNHRFDNRCWQAFWKTVDSRVKHDAVWGLFNKVRFYEVVEVEADV